MRALSLRIPKIVYPRVVLVTGCDDGVVKNILPGPVQSAVEQTVRVVGLIKKKSTSKEWEKRNKGRARVRTGVVGTSVAQSTQNPKG